MVIEVCHPFGTASFHLVCSAALDWKGLLVAFQLPNLLPAAVSAVNVYTWGSNPNVSLGHEHSKENPELLLEVNRRHTIVEVSWEGGRKVIQLPFM